MKLLPMLEFVLKDEWKKFDCHSGSDALNRIKCYAKFLSQPISLSMFVAPDQLMGVLPAGKTEPVQTAFFPELEDKVLFKDLVIKHDPVTKKYSVLKKNGFFVITGQKAMFDSNVTIESLVHRELELTDTAVKLIFGGNV